MKPTNNLVSNRQNNPAVGDDSNRLAELVQNLPLRIRMGICKHELAIARALECKYLIITRDGHLKWLLQGTTMLAYFCGKVWCGDCARRGKWMQGKAVFPDKDLALLFEQKGLKQIRYGRNGLPLPEFFELVDNLFVNR